MIQNGLMQYRLAPLALFCISFCGQAQNRQTQGIYSREKESALGTALAAQLRRQTTPLGLASVDSYVEELGRQLAAQMPNTPEHWTFSVIRDQKGGSTYEPVSLPGGFIFVPTQLILATHNEAEFAGMLAHAMAHVAKRQAFRQMRRSEVAQLATIPLIFLGGTAGFAEDDDYTIVPVGFLKLHRQYELEADRLAVGVTAAAGYDPNGLLNYIGRTQPRITKRPEELSALPPLSIRLSNLEESIRNLPALRSYVSGNAFYSIQNEVGREQTPVSAPTVTHPIPSLLHPNR